MANTIKIVSYNIHKGISTLMRKSMLNKIKEMLHESDADLVFLQEVRDSSQRIAKSDSRSQARVRREVLEEKIAIDVQFEFLADGLWSHYAYGRNALYDYGSHGNVILSKYPIADWTNIDISTNRFEKRGILYAELEIPESSERLHAVCTHLDLTLSGRTKQLLQLSKFISEKVPSHEPLIVAGDFNDWSMIATAPLTQTNGLKEIHKTLHGHYARTFPSRLPLLSLDRIYFRNLAPVKAHILDRKDWRFLSDHKALYAELSIGK